MKTIIAGSRSVTDYEMVRKWIEQCPWTVTKVLSGHAKGVDRLGERWAAENGVPVLLFIPDWEGQGRKAGILRNAAMAKEAEGLIAVWDGYSVGTEHMLSVARRIPIPVHSLCLSEADPDYGL